MWIRTIETGGLRADAPLSSPQTQVIDQERWQTFADFALEQSGLIRPPGKRCVSLLAP